MRYLAVRMEIERIVLWRCQGQRSGRFLKMDLSLAILVRMLLVWKHRKPDCKSSKTYEREKIVVFCSIIKDFRKNGKEKNGQRRKMSRR